MKEDGFWYELLSPTGRLSSSRMMMFVAGFAAILFWPLSYIVEALNGMSKDCMYLLGIAMIGKAASDGVKLLKPPTKEQ